MTERPWRLATLLLCGLQARGAQAGPAAPPQQPLDGPGGSHLAHADLRQWHGGEQGSEYWLFTPAAPVPALVPLVVFVHGWSLMQPDLYRAWIEHIVRRGAIVLYPRYRQNLRRRPPSACAMPPRRCAGASIASIVTSRRIQFPSPRADANISPWPREPRGREAA